MPIIRKPLTSSRAVNAALGKGFSVYCTVTKFGDRVLLVHRARAGKVTGAEGAYQVLLLEGWQTPSEVWCDAVERDHEDDQTRGPQERSFL